MKTYTVQRDLIASEQVRATALYRPASDTITLHTHDGKEVAVTLWAVREMLALLPKSERDVILTSLQFERE